MEKDESFLETPKVCVRIFDHEKAKIRWMSLPLRFHFPLTSLKDKFSMPLSKIAWIFPNIPRPYPGLWHWGQTRNTSSCLWLVLAASSVCNPSWTCQILCNFNYFKSLLIKHVTVFKTCYKMCLGLSILKEIINVSSYELTMISAVVVQKMIAHNYSKWTHYEDVLDKQ